MPAVVDFKKMLSNIYNPLGKQELINMMAAPPSTLQPCILANVTINNLIKHTLDADQQTSSDHCVPAKGDAIEDVWLLASDEMESEPLAAASETPADKVGEPAVPETSAVDVEVSVPALEDLWLSAGEDEVEVELSATMDMVTIEIEGEGSTPRNRLASPR